MGRGKIERVFQTIQQQFAAEITGSGEDDPARHPVADLGELNDLLDHWVRAVYHQRAHTETGESPQARFAAAGPPVLPDAALLREALSCSAERPAPQTPPVPPVGTTSSPRPVPADPQADARLD